MKWTPSNRLTCNHFVNGWKHGDGSLASNGCQEKGYSFVIFVEFSVVISGNARAILSPSTGQTDPSVVPAWPVDGS